MAQGSGKNQDSTGIVTSGDYTAKCIVPGMGKQNIVLNCPGIIDKRKADALQIALEHAKAELGKRFKGRNVKVKSVSI